MGVYELALVQFEPTATKETVHIVVDQAQFGSLVGVLGRRHNAGGEGVRRREPGLYCTEQQDDPDPSDT